MKKILSICISLALVLTCLCPVVTDEAEAATKIKAVKISKLSSEKKSITVKWKKPEKKVTGYEIRYSTAKSMKNAKKKTIKSYKNTTKKITELKSGKKYYVQIRAYKLVDGKKKYSTWSEKKYITTKKAASGTSVSGGDGNTVYITETGTKYHYDSGCRGLNGADSVFTTSKSEAVELGYELCGWED